MNLSKTFANLALSLLCPLFASAATPAEIFKTRMQPPLAGAHQGGFYKGCPNTIKQFKAAKNDGVDIMEMDLRITKDNVVIIFHDEDLKAQTNCKGLVRDHTWDEIKDCKYTIGRQKIPTFEEVLIWANAEIVLNAEFKTADAIPQTLALIEKYQAKSWVFFQCNLQEYQQARALDPEVLLLYRMQGPDDMPWALANNDPALVVFEVDERTRDPQLISALKATGRLVLEDSWHFSKTQEIFGAACGKAYQAGIDIAITNNPRSCVKQRDQF